MLYEYRFSEFHQLPSLSVSRICTFLGQVAITRFYRGKVEEHLNQMVE